MGSIKFCVNDIRDGEFGAIAVGIHVQGVENSLLSRLSRRASESTIRADDQGITKISHALRRSGYESINILRTSFAGLFEIHEEKCFLLLDGPAKGEPILILDVLGIRDSLARS